jgi:hypothetical protein
MNPWILVLACAAADDLVLVSGGSSDYEIVRAERAPASTSLAARELAHFLERSTGVRLPEVAAPTPGRKRLFVGANPHSLAAGIDPRDLKPEGFRIRTVGDDLHIVGVDTPGNPEQVKRTLPVQCGTLFGVYEFLERHAGVLFAWHDDLGTIVPARKEIRVPPIDLVQAPDWATRSFTDSPSGAAGLLFGRRLRLGASVQTDYTHNWFRILPVETYGKDHPEYYALVGGQRKAAYYLKNHGGQVCTTNPEVIERFAQAAIEWFDRNPGDHVFPISPNDGKGFCECGPCRALDPPASGTKPRHSERMMTFYNAVAERVARVHPRKFLGAFVYATYQRPPAGIKPHPNLALTHATNRAYAQGMGWDREREDERTWTSLASNLVKYDIYYYADSGGLHVPGPITRHLGEKLRAEHEAGFRGGYLYISPSYELLGAGHYLMARLMWDRKADLEALEKRYYDALYGAAGPDVLDYYRLLEARLRKMRLEGIDLEEPILARLSAAVDDDEDSAAYTVAAFWPVLDEASRVLDRARGRALDARERERLARLEDHHELLHGTVRGLVAAGRVLDRADPRPEDLRAFRSAVERREAARERIRRYAPTLSEGLDGDDAGRLSLLSAKGALFRLASRERPGAPIRIDVPNGGFDDPDLAGLGFTAQGGATLARLDGALRVAVPAHAQADLRFEVVAKPGALYRLSLLHRSRVAAFRYDHTRQAPLLRIERPNRRRSTPSLRSGVPALVATDSWTPYRFVFEAPAGGGPLHLRFSFPHEGTFDLDDVQLEELP